MSHSRRTIAAAIVAIGFISAHTVAYNLVYTDPVARTHALEHSGHGWLPTIPFITVGAFLALIAGLSHRHADVRARWGIVPATTAMYIAVEVGERWASSSHHGLVEARTLILGALIAAACSAAAMMLLSGAGIALERAARPRVSSPARAIRSVFASVGVVVLHSQIQGACQVRGPPQA